MLFVVVWRWLSLIVVVCHCVLFVARGCLRVVVGGSLVFLGVVCCGVFCLFFCVSLFLVSVRCDYALLFVVRCCCVLYIGVCGLIFVVVC